MIRNFQGHELASITWFRPDRKPDFASLQEHTEDFHVLTPRQRELVAIRISEYLTEDEWLAAKEYIGSHLQFGVHGRRIKLPIYPWFGENDGCVRTPFRLAEERSYMGLFSVVERHDYNLPFTISGHFFDPLEHHKYCDAESSES
jgi:hypothetical protein